MSMYSERDYADISRRVRRNWALLGALALALLALFAVALRGRVQWLAYASGLLLAVSSWFVFAFFQLPCLRYRRFLSDMQEGLSREMTGRVVDVSSDADLQDGARVLPVRLMLQDEQDERIVYLNASKQEDFPEAGTLVKLRLCGRHIREVELLPERTDA